MVGVIARFHHTPSFHWPSALIQRLFKPYQRWLYTISTLEASAYVILKPGDDEVL